MEKANVVIGNTIGLYFHFSGSTTHPLPPSPINADTHTAQPEAAMKVTPESDDMLQESEGGLMWWWVLKADLMAFLPLSTLLHLGDVGCVCE